MYSIHVQTYVYMYLHAKLLLVMYKDKQQFMNVQISVYVCCICTSHKAHLRTTVLMLDGVPGAAAPSAARRLAAGLEDSL